MLKERSKMGIGIIYRGICRVWSLGASVDSKHNRVIESEIGLHSTVRGIYRDHVSVYTYMYIFMYGGNYAGMM